MRKKTLNSREPFPVEEFPDTRASLLEEAALGDWEPFLREYLRPCWREVLLVCRQWNLALPDADDLFQELMVRLFRPGTFKKRIREAIAAKAPDAKLVGNLPERYLVFTRALGQSARFRTYLKQMVVNVVREALRAKARNPRLLDSAELQAFVPEVEQSISRSVDEGWFHNCLALACRRLHEESSASRTKGKRRLFELFYFTVAKNQSIEEIARRLGVQRTALSPYVAQARTRFVAHLQQATGIDDLTELMALVVRHRQALQAALEASHRSL